MVVSQISLNLGIDFGTKYTKICVRDTDRDESWVVLPGTGNSRLEGALILSQVGIRDDGILVAGLTEAEWLDQRASCALIIDFIKMRLAHLDSSEQSANWYSPELPNFQGFSFSSSDLENLCAFFLYQVIKRARQWIYQSDSARFVNVVIDWSAAVGVPVEYCDSPSLIRFQRVLCLAWSLCHQLDVPQLSLAELKRRLERVRRSLDMNSLPCFAIPEIAAAVYSYTASRQARQGIYLFFDIGGGTIEGAAFKFYRIDDQLQMDFLSGLVKPVGVNALAKRITEDCPRLESQVDSTIINRGDQLLSNIARVSAQYVSRFPLKPGDFIANKHRVSVRAIQKNLSRNNINLYLIQILILSQAIIHRQVAKVIRNSCSRLNHTERASISVFLGGGGKLSTYYQDTIDATYDTFNLGSTGMTRYRMLDVPRPRDFDMKGLDEQHFHRFSIAYGLSIPDYQAPEFRLPSQFPDTPPPPTGPGWTPETSHPDG